MRRLLIVVAACLAVSAVVVHERPEHSDAPTRPAWCPDPFATPGFGTPQYEREHPLPAGC